MNNHEFVTMRPRQLIVFGFMLACAGLSDERGLGPPAYKGVQVQEAAGPEAEPESQQSMQEAQPEPFTWRFPEDPVDTVTQPQAKVELQQRPTTSDRVAVRCGESRIQVEASQDLLGLGKLVNPEEVTLGGCPATEVDDLSHVLVFEYELHACGSTLVMTEDAFIYAFALVYNPKVSGSLIIRSQSAVIGVECHYPR